MNLPLTYGQCLRKIMQSNRLSINELSRKLGFHSPTQLSRILNDEVSPTLITKFHHQFMLIFDWLISPAEIKSLSTSLQYSCLGEEAFLTQRAMYNMLFERPALTADAIPLFVHPAQASGSATLRDLFTTASSHRRIDLLILGSSFDALLPLFSEMLPPHNSSVLLSIRHFFVMEDKPAQLVSRICTLLPFLNKNAYEGAYCTESDGEVFRFLQHNSIAIARAQTAKGNCVTIVFTPPQKDGLSVYRMEDNDTLFTFYAGLVDRYRDHLRPIKSVYPQPKTLSNLLTLCQRDLFLEQNRACCFVRLDFCFHALPTAVVLNAVDGGARLGLTPDDPIMQEMRRVHEARYRNLLEKAEPTCFILSRPALLSFIRTGHMSDHLFAMRDFTPQERRDVLAPLVEAIKQNPMLQVHFFRDDTLAPISAFAAYQDMGMQISANNTAYDLDNNHEDVFIGQPDFAQTFRNYCMNTLIPEYCLDRSESLAFLEELLKRLDDMVSPATEV